MIDTLTNRVGRTMNRGWMPYRNKATVQSWVDEYLAANPAEALIVTVLEKDFTPGPDSGMVIVALRNASTVTYIHPVGEAPRANWVVTFEPRVDSFDLDADGVAGLSADLAALARICTYLQERTEAARSVEVPAPAA